MRSLLRPILFLALLVGLLLPTGDRPYCRADDAAVDPEKIREEFDKGWQSFLEQQQRVRAFTGVPALDESAAKNTLQLVITDGYWGLTYFGYQQAKRFLVLDVTFLNPTSQPIEVSYKNMRLLAGTTEVPLEQVTGRVQYQSFVLRGKHYSLQSLKGLPEFTLQPGEAKTHWVNFSDLAASRNIPNLVLKMQNGAQQAEYSINDYFDAELKLAVDRLGPQDCIARLTIDGRLDTVNLGYLNKTIEDLTAKEVSRFVLRWTEKAEQQIDSQIVTWLLQGAKAAGTQADSNSKNLPLFPSNVRAMSLTGLKSANGDVRNQSVVFDSETEAIAETLKNLYESLPPREIIYSLRSDSDATRYAALRYGGRRLSSAEVPLLLSLLEDQNPEIQQAAVFALRYQHDDRTMSRLTRLARDAESPLRQAALESLAQSRYPRAVEIVSGLLQTEPPAARQSILEVLAASGRGEWADLLYEYLNRPDTELQSGILKALVVLGHPQVQSVLKSALKHTDTEIRQEALKYLIAAEDPESEQIALEYTLKELRTTPPDNNMVILLNRTRDARAVPLLWEHLEANPASRPTLISLLGNLGDREVAQKLSEYYDEWTANEQAAILRALQAMKSERFFELAPRALMSDSTSVVNVVCQALMSDGSDQAVDLLIEAWEKNEHAGTWHYIINALAALPTEKSREAMRKSRFESDLQRRGHAVNALRMMLQRSPGYRFYALAQQQVEQKKYDAALKLFDLALQADAQMGEAYSGRGHVLLIREKYAEARQDFLKLKELDPDDSQLITGLALIDVAEGNLQQGIEAVEKHRKRFPANALYAYNAACVYAKAIAVLNERADFPDRERMIAAYRRQALDDLKSAVQLGFHDLKWMQEDPDLTALHDVPEFKAITGGPQQ